MAINEPVLGAKAHPLWAKCDYLLLWSGQAASSLGSQLSLFAFALLMLALRSLVATLNPYLHTAPHARPGQV